MTQKFDLLGDPIPDNHGKPGANGHIATAENVSKVRGLLASGKDKRDIALELGITLPTLTKHYFQSGKLSVKNARRKARADLRAKLMLKLDEQVGKGNVSAMRTMKQILDEEDVRDAAQEAATAPTATKPAALPKGKKEALTAAAEQAIDADPLLNPEHLH
ncbi:hypothetical protein [Pacificoceanicola onchidii]|uniref:hypothetical protein n=1 Tax=Pacificoceanicola onchidii TaxID=2562685 RepID=UPI0010A453C2|nr:hypothetical protein [Pacificoceanicola onchidii]